MTREERIAEMISSCTECGGRDFPKLPNCDGCIAAVDEAIAQEVANIENKMQFGFKSLKPECHFDSEVVGEYAPYVSDERVDWAAHATIVGYSIMVGVSNALLVNR